MMRRALAALASLCLIGGVASQAVAKTNAEEPKDFHYAGQGMLSKFDQGQLQRGFKVYSEVCSSCHSMDLLYYRNLAQKDGPFYSPKYPNPAESPYAKAIAADVKVPDIDQDTGDAITRPGTAADQFKAPFPNKIAAAAANGGAAPPDLSVMARAREGGPAYIYSLLQGYGETPKGLNVPAGKYYNPYMQGDLASSWTGPKDKTPHGGFIAMPFQLTPNRVTFDDGTKATTEQEARDVSVFMAWAADPKQTERKEAGVAVMLYLIVFAVILWFSYKRIWRDVAH